MDVVAYARVSFDCPPDEFLGAEEQIATVKVWASRNDHRVVAEFVDEGETASADLAKRLALADALDAIRDRRAAGLIVARLDRLAPDVIVQELLGVQVKAIGGAWFSAHPDEEREPTEDPVDESRVLIRRVLDSDKEFKDAMRRLTVFKRVGKFPPEDASEESALARIEQLADQGLGLQDIAQRLSAEGFRPRLHHLLNIAGLKKIVDRLRADAERRRWAQ